MPIPKLTAGFSKPSDATAYAAGDLVANSLTAASVVPLQFDLQGDIRSGKVLGARMVIQPASGNLVITALDLDLLIFRNETGIPFAAGGYPADNAALALTEAQMKELVAVIPFVTGAWRNPAGALTAGARGWQAVSLATPRPFALRTDERPALLGLLQVKGAWTPGAVVQAVTVDLDVEG